MEWKRKLRKEAVAMGHRLSPLVRDKSVYKGGTPVKAVPLAQRENEYNALCSRCRLEVHAFTAPGSQVQITYGRVGQRVGNEMPPCLKSRVAARRKETLDYETTK